jgi:mRNA-degrading endonuclease YafQ of YafQ-DinJ toxin-antitoxin module
MNFHFTSSFQRKVEKLCKKDSKLKSELIKQFLIFQENHKHPSLKLHKLKGKRSSQYVIWIKNDLRTLAVKSGSVFIFFDLAMYDQY